MSISWSMDLDAIFVLYFPHVIQMLFPWLSIQREQLTIVLNETLLPNFLYGCQIGMATFLFTSIGRFAINSWCDHFIDLCCCKIHHFMLTSLMFTQLGREHRQEITNNHPTKPSQHHPSCALISILLQVPCPELPIYPICMWEQEIHLLTLVKGLF